MLMKRLAAVFFVLLTLPGLALAQIPFTKVSPTVTLSVSSVSSSVAIGTSARISNLWICNTGATDAYLQMGDSTIVADTTGTLMRSGRCGNVSPDGKLFIASVTASSTTTLSITPGSGIMFTDGGGGGGSGSGTMGSVTIATSNGATNTGTCTSTTTINCTLSINEPTFATVLTSQQDASSWSGSLIVLNNAGAQTLTLQNLTANQFYTVINKGAGVWTFTAGVSLINSGCTSVSQNQSATIQFDGSVWNIACGAGTSIALPLTGANGGTGIANTGKTVTLGASVTTTGAGAPTLAFPATPQTYTVPATTDTLVGRASTDTLTNKSIAASEVNSGQIGLAQGGTNADLSATGGTSQFLKQASASAAITVVRPACADLSDSTAACSTAVGTSGATIPLLSTANTWTTNQTFSAVIAGTAGILLTANAAAANIPVAYRNTSANAAASTNTNIGNNSSNTEVVFQLNSSANTTVGSSSNGTSSFTINNTEATNTGGIFFQTQGTNAVTISKAQAVGLPGLASSSAAQTGTVCWSSGGGNLTVDTTVACLASLEELKNIKGPIVGALDKVMALKPFWYSWKDVDHYKMDPHDQPGLGAHQVEGVDIRLAGYDPKGKLTGVRYQQMVAVLVAAMQEQQRKINALEAKLTKPRHK